MCSCTRPGALAVIGRTTGAGSIRGRSISSRNAARVSAGAGGADWAETTHAPSATNNAILPMCDSPLRKLRGRYPALRCLLERVRDLDQARLAAGASRKADAERRRPGVEAGRKRRLGCIRHEPERDDHRRIPGLCRHRGASRPGNSSASSRSRFMTASIPSAPVNLTSAARSAR